MTGRHDNGPEADRAVLDLQKELWIRARRSRAGDDRESLEYVIEKQAELLRELARSNGMVLVAVIQRASTLLEKRTKAGAAA